MRFSAFLLDSNQLTVVPDFSVFFFFFFSQKVFEFAIGGQNSTEHNWDKLLICVTRNLYVINYTDFLVFLYRQN